MIVAVMENGKVVGSLVSTINTRTAKSIKVVDKCNTEGEPSSFKKYAISRSKRNISIAEYKQPLSLIIIDNESCFTFRCVENNKIVY